MWISSATIISQMVIILSESLALQIYTSDAGDFSISEDVWRFCMKGLRWLVNFDACKIKSILCKSRKNTISLHEACFCVSALRTTKKETVQIIASFSLHKFVFEVVAHRWRVFRTSLWWMLHQLKPLSLNMYGLLGLLIVIKRKNN